MDIEREIEITHYYGIHARPSATISGICTSSNSKVFLYYKDQVANGKDALELMSLGAPCGGKILFKISGDDAEEVFFALSEAFQNNFGL